MEQTTQDAEHRLLIIIFLHEWVWYRLIYVRSELNVVELTVD